MVRRTTGGRSDRKDPRKKTTPSRARGQEKPDHGNDDLIAEDEQGPVRAEQDDPKRARAARSGARASDPSARLEHGDSVEEEARSYDVAADRDDYERGYGLRDHDRDAATRERERERTRR